MKRELKSCFVLVGVMLLATAAVHAQSTSRMIAFSGLQTTLPASTTQAVTVQMWDDAAEGTLIVSEDQPAVSVDEAGRISFLFGSITGGLNPDHFPSGASRFLDVIDPGTGASVLTGGRIALNATAFALSPGPQGPEGPPGPPGAVGSVSAGDSSILVGGTASAPSVAVATNGIDNTKVADGALSPVKIAGTAAILGANAFIGNQGITGELTATGAINTGVQYNIGGNRVVSIAGTNNLFVGVGAGISATGSLNAFFGQSAGLFNTTGSDNSFFGAFAGRNNTTETRNTFIGASSNGAAGITNATAIGANARVTQSNSVVLGFNANVGIGTSAPIRPLTVNGRARIGFIPQEPSVASVCFNPAGDLLQCGASSLRLKMNVKPFRSGLDIVRRLRPISFNWKESGVADIGLGAEDVAQVAPSLVFTNKGQVEGVKYDRLNMVLINAVNEQQQEIEQLRAELRQLQQAISRRHTRRGRR